MKCRWITGLLGLWCGLISVGVEAGGVHSAIEEMNQSFQRLRSKLQ